MAKMWEEILEQPAVLERCGKSNEETIKRLASHIRGRNIRSVVIAARGTSDHAGIYGKYLAEYALGIPVALAAPSIFTIYGKRLRRRKK